MIKVLTVYFGNNSTHSQDILTLEKHLNDNWQIIRVDSTSICGKGDSSHFQIAPLIYILVKPS